MGEPTTERLARALGKSGAPPDMIARARSGYYDDYKSELVDPIIMLDADLRKLGLFRLAARVRAGEFDGTREESEEWARSPEGQETLWMFGI